MLDTYTVERPPERGRWDSPKQWAVKELSVCGKYVVLPFSGWVYL